MMDIRAITETTLQAKRRLEAGYKRLRNERIGELFAMIVMQTPVKTGQARAGWTIDTGEVEWPSGRLDPEGHDTIAAGRKALERIHHWANVVISNGEPHITSLEDGWSQQAPMGIIRVVLPAFKSMHGDVV